MSFDSGIEGHISGELMHIFLNDPPSHTHTYILFRYHLISHCRIRSRK
jgi:hypothetical protein